MGLNINSKIAYEGLTICFDPSNPASYPGSGNIIYDISGNGNNGDLTSVGFSVANQGHLTFNGTSSFIQFPSTTLNRTTGSCISVWFNVTDFTNFAANKTVNSRSLFSAISGYNQLVALYEGGFGFETDTNSNPDDIASNTSPDFPHAEITAGVWVNFAMSFLNNVATIYIDGENVRTINVGDNTTFQYIGNILAPDNYPDYFKGGIGSFFLYERSLSAEEIKLNYNASKLKYLV